MNKFVLLTASLNQRNSGDNDRTKLAVVSWQGTNHLNFSLSENFLLVEQFSSKNTKFGAKNRPF